MGIVRKAAFLIVGFFALISAPNWKCFKEKARYIWKEVRLEA